MSAAKDNSTGSTIATNRRARFDYEIEDTVEAGIMLVGSEVKALRGGRVTIAEAYAGKKEGELWLFNLHIPTYEAANRFNHEPKRHRKLLLKKRELGRLFAAVDQKGVTLVPTHLYFNKDGRVKLELGLGKGKKAHDKRQTEKDRDWKRGKARLMRDMG